jgi:hypothetical protein
MNEVPAPVYNDLNRLMDGKLNPWKTDELRDLNISTGAKEMPVYIGKENRRCILPTKSQIASATGGNRVTVDRRLKTFLDMGVIVKVTIPELVRTLGIKRLRGAWDYEMPAEFSWMGKYLNDNYMEIRRKSGSTHSLEMKKANFDSPFYERHYISNLLDENDQPYYLNLNLHVKDK